MRIGIDAGGTFTDFVILHDDGRLESFKLRSSRSAPARVILEGLRRIAAPAAADFIHGSTVATNALLERKGARTAFVTTEGFADLARIGRQNRARLYDLTPPLKRHLVPRTLCFGVGERTHFDGAIARKPSAAELDRLRARLRRAGVESIAICFLHSYQNAVNERAAAARLQGLGYVCASHEVSPEIREYERASTTIINAYVGPLMDAYLAELDRGARQRISILQSNGGFISAREARRHAVRTILSGPAGGVVGAAAVARAAGFKRALTFDMGGTSTDVSLSEAAPRLTTEAYVDGFPVRVPMVDIHTVGAGGGSIARVDEGGLLRVGPESAGADPGPACYGTGRLPTVTDAHVLLGRIAADQFLAGEMRIRAKRALDAIRPLAAALGITAVAAAAGILRVANANMERAIRVVSIERGHDPRDFPLVAFGGCGGLHACEIAEGLGISTVIVPEYAGALSALGMLLADRVRDYSAGVLGADVEQRFAALERAARRDMPGAALERLADVRYAGQSYELTIPWGASFHAAHQRVYGYSNPERPTEIVTVRVRAALETSKPTLRRNAARVRTAAAKRRVFTGGKWVTLPVYQRAALASGRRRGPALVLDYGATTLIPHGWSFHIDSTGNLIASG
ncbi:MAG: hydantoinase/oxoprolinase family protein [Candidatus Solibacter usitatus]|nr:hydantoinase/oxoprolinase family protein [Candidatus Solibacter usitatus]